MAKAFKLEGKKDLLKRGDAGPTSAAGGVGCGTHHPVFIVILVILLLVRACMDDERCEQAPALRRGRSSGGSYGGYSSGGGHK